MTHLAVACFKLPRYLNPSLKGRGETLCGWVCNERIESHIEKEGRPGVLIPHLYPGRVNIVAWRKKSADLRTPEVGRP